MFPDVDPYDEDLFPDEGNYDEPYLTSEEKQPVEDASRDRFKVQAYVDIDEEKNFFKLKVNVFYFSRFWDSSALLNKTFVYPFPRNMEDFEGWKEEKENESLSKYREFIKYQSICTNSPEKSGEITAEEIEYINPHRWYKNSFY